MDRSESGKQSGLLRSLLTLADMARLRLLRLIDQEELSVGELAKILQLPQSTVSRHLKLLLESAWIVRRSEGTASLYRMDSDALSPDVRELWSLARRQLGTSPTLQEDDHRLAEVLAERRTDSKAFFGRIGGEWDRVRCELFGEAFITESMLSFLDPSWVVADLGCGTGSTAEYLAGLVRKVIAVDREPAMLESARRRLAGVDNVEFRQDDLSDLSLGDAEVDAVIVSLVMVYIPQPQDAVREIARILRPGGCALFVDMVAHDRTAYLHTMGQQHLGFDEKAVEGWAKAAGLTDVRYRRLRPDTSSKGPGLFVATMRKPSTAPAKEL